MATRMITVRISLNGSDKNPYLEMGLLCNPFPAVADASPRFQALNEAVRVLGSTPIRDKEHLRQLLVARQADPLFIEKCLERFQKGKIVSFNITFPDEG